MSHPNYTAACNENRTSDSFRIRRGSKSNYPPSEDTPEYRVCSNCAARSSQVGSPIPKTFCLNPDSPFFDIVIGYEKSGCSEFIYGSRFEKEYRNI